MAAKAAGEKLSKKEIFLSTWRRIARNWGLYLLLVPAVVLLFMFTYIPMYGIQIAFKDFTPKAGIQKDERDKPVLGKYPN
jgi:ABC-type polysaccharide transport system permease subunit